MNTPYYQAVYTQYMGPTNTRGARIRVTIQRGADTVTKSYPYDYASPHPHETAAQTALNDFLGKNGDTWELIGAGESPKGYVFLACWKEQK